MIFLQKCGKADIPAAAQMMCTVYAEPPWSEKWQLDRAEKRIAGFLSGDYRRGYAMILERDPIGYLFGRIDLTAKNDIFYVDELFVHPRYQRKGSGSMAMVHLAQELKKEGISRIELHTISEDVSFYEKNGFVKSSYRYLEKKI